MCLNIKQYGNPGNQSVCFSVTIKKINLEIIALFLLDVKLKL